MGVVDFGQYRHENGVLTKVVPMYSQLDVDAKLIFEGQDGKSLGTSLVEYCFVSSSQGRGTSSSELVYLA